MKRNQLITISILIIFSSISFAYWFYYLKNDSTIKKETEILNITVIDVEADELIIKEISKNLNVSTIEMEKNELKDIKKKIDDLIQRNPENYKAYTELARYYFKVGYKYTNSDLTQEYDQASFFKAKQAIEKALSINPSYADAYIYYGNYLEAIKKFNLAELNYHQAENLGAVNPKLYEKWGMLLLHLNKNDEAFNKLNKIVEINSDDKTLLASAHELIGKYYEEKKNDYQSANIHYLKAIEIRPNNAWIKGTYSTFLRERFGDIDGALKYAKEALSIRDYGIGRQILASALYSKWAILVNSGNNGPEAAQYFNYAYSLFPNLNNIFVWQGGMDISQYIIEPLLNKKVSINAKNDTGYTAINYAAAQGQEKAVEKLLRLGADSSIPANDRWTPILQAVDKGNIIILRMLLGANANLNHLQYTYALQIIERKKANDIEKYGEIKKILMEKKLPQLRNMSNLPLG